MKKGFTLIEVLLTVSIVVVLSTVAVINLSGNRRKADLDSATQQVAVLLREAQSNSVSQSKGSTWGVHFDNTNPASAFYSLFYSANSTYASSVSAGQYPLPADICYATSSVGTGSSTDIIFSSISGAPAASATITFQLMSSGGCATATSSVVAGVSRSASGKIFFDDFNRSSL